MASASLPLGASLSMTVAVGLVHVKELRGWIDKCLIQARHSLTERQNAVTAVSEIVTNVIKHADPPAKSVTVEFQVNKAGEYIVIRDNGGEFKNYAQFCGRETVEQDGANFLESGMGLAITRQLFPDQYYVAAAASTSGLNEFWLALRQAAADTSRPSVALVDDDLALRQVIENYLIKDYDVVSFSNATTAMGYLSNHPVNIVISDINMPDMSGMEFRQVLAKNPLTDVVPFIFLTGDTTLSTQDAAVDLGVDDYLVKPLRKEQLLSVVKRILKRAQAVRTNLNSRLDENITASLCPEVTKDYGDFRIVSRTRNAKAGGGDFFFAHESAKHLLVVLGDIMGHGEQAKFFAHAHAGYFHGLANSTNADLPPAEYLKKLSAAISYSTVLEATLVTCLAVRLGLDGSISIASAGHPAPWLINERGIGEVNVGGALPGLVEGVEYLQAEIALGGGRLALYTDGLVECGSNNEKRASLLAGIRSHLVRSWPGPIDGAAQSTMQAFIDLTARQAEDDATLVLIEKRR